MRSVGFFYSGSIPYAIGHDCVGDILANDEIVLTGHSAHDALIALTPHQRLLLWAQTYFYVDCLGASYYRQAEASIPRYFPGPGDDEFGNMPEWRTDRGVCCYRIDAHHVRRFMGAYWAFINSEYMRLAKGVFLDDAHFEYAPTSYWRFEPGVMEKVWPFLGEKWKRLFDNFETAMHYFASLRGKKVMFNGPTDRAPRLFESVGKWKTLSEVADEARQGDTMLIKGINGDRETWAKTDGGRRSYQDLFVDALNLAEKMDLKVGLSMIDNPTGGGSALGVHAFSNPKTWEKL